MAKKKPYTRESVYASIVYEGAKTPRQIQQDHGGNDDAGALNRILEELRAAGHVRMGGIDHLLSRGSVSLPTDPYNRPAAGIPEPDPNTPEAWSYSRANHVRNRDRLDKLSGGDDPDRPVTRATPDPVAIGAQLKEMRAKVKAGPEHGVTAEQAAALLDGLTAAQLKEVAKASGVAVDYRSKTKAALTGHILRTTVGSALDHHAVVGYPDQGIAPDWARKGEPAPDTGQQWSRPRDDVPPDHPDSRESVEREFAAAQRREDEMREKYPQAAHKVFLRRDLSTGDCKEAVGWKYGMGWHEEVATWPWTEDGLRAAGQWAVENRAHDDMGHTVTDPSRFAASADSPTWDRRDAPRCERCGAGAQLPNQTLCAVCVRNDEHVADVQEMVKDHDTERADRERKRHEDGEVPEPPDGTALVDRGGGTWVRTDDMPGARGSWWPLTDGPGWDEWARDGIGSSRTWDDMAEHGPFEQADPERTQRARDRVRREWLLDHPEEGDATPNGAPSSAAAPAGGGKLEFNYDRIVQAHQQVLADMGALDQQALDVAGAVRSAYWSLEGADEARDDLIAKCEALLDGMAEAKLDATSIAGITEAAESLDAAKVAGLMGRLEETSEVAREVAKEAFLAGEGVRASLTHIRDAYVALAAGVQETGVRGEALEGAGA